jgi:two-component system, OmpR family, sensor kinase
MTLTFKSLLALWHVIVVAVILGGAAAGAQWILSRTVLGTVIDDALLSLAETEAAALLADPAAPLRIHEMAPGTAPPSFVRLDRPSGGSAARREPSARTRPRDGSAAGRPRCRPAG